jgi:hypothetical protein
MDIESMATRVAAAKPVPEIVAAGERISALAAKYEDLASKYAEIEESVRSSRAQLGDMLQSPERNVSLEAERLLKKMASPGFIRKDSLALDAKSLAKTAELLKSALR